MSEGDFMRLVKIATLSRIKYIKSISREDYIKICLSEVQKAGEEKCDIVCLPEWFDSFGSAELKAADPKRFCEKGYDISNIVRSLAESVPGRLTDMFAEVAKKYGMNIILPFIEEDGDKLYNTAVVLDRKGGIAGKYRKTHLYPPEGRCMGITPGDEIKVIELDFGKIGIVICMEFYFPELFRVLTLKGAEIIFWPTQSYGPTVSGVEMQFRAKALDYSCYMVTSTFASEDYYAPYVPGHESTGRAYIVNYDGMIIADTGYYPGLAIAQVDLDRIRVNAEMVSMRLTGIDHMREDFLKLRRPELYAEICKPVDNSAYFNNKFFDE